MVKIKDHLVCLMGGSSASEKDFLSGKMSSSTYLNDIFIYNLQEDYWESPIVGGFCPTGRFSCVISSNNEDAIMIMGGQASNQKTDQNVYQLLEKEHEAWRIANPGFKKHQVNEFITELQDTENIIETQKREMNELEYHLRTTKQNIADLLARRTELGQMSEASKENFSKTMAELNSNIRGLNSDVQRHQQLMETIAHYESLLEKKERLQRAKTMSLEQTFRAGEAFAIEMDRMFTMAVQGDLFYGVLKDSMIMELLKMKNEHKKMLAEMIEGFTDLGTKESELREQIKEQKRKIAFDLNETFSKNLTKEELALLKQFGIHKS